MANKTLPTLNAAPSVADDTIFLVRRNGQIEDEKAAGSIIKTYLFTAAVISGATIDNSVIGGTTPAAGTFTTLVANTINTGQGAVECYAMDQAVRTTDAVTFSSLMLTTALAVAQGGTGATDAAGARTNLGLVIGTNVQAYDAGLQSIAGLTTAANNGIYTTALDTYATYSLTAGGRALGGVAGTANTFPYFSAANVVTLGAITAAGRALIDDADASAQRTTLGLAIGTNVQAYDAGLQSIAGLTTAADNMIYTTALDVYATTTLTAFGRSLIDDTTAANARTTLGLGTIATQDSTNVSITGGAISGIADLAVADGGTGASTAAGARTNLELVKGTAVGNVVTVENVGGNPGLPAIDGSQLLNIPNPVVGVCNFDATTANNLTGTASRPNSSNVWTITVTGLGNLMKPGHLLLCDLGGGGAEVILVSSITNANTVVGTGTVQASGFTGAACTCRFWTIRNAKGIDSIAYLNSTGQAAVNFTNNQPDTNWSLLYNVGGATAGGLITRTFEATIGAHPGRGTRYAVIVSLTNSTSAVACSYNYVTLLRG